MRRPGFARLLGRFFGAFALAAALWGAVAVALEPHGNFSSIGAVPLDRLPLLAVFGDYVEQSAAWRDLDAKAQRSLEAWRSAGGDAQVLRLGQHGLPGHSHMMMMDEGSGRIATLIVEWLADVTDARSA